MAQVPVYDKSGTVVGWYRETAGIDLLFDLEGHRLAFVEAGAFIIRFDASQAGVFRQKHFCDTAGNPVAFLAGAVGGPPKPQLAPEPAQPAQFDDDPAVFQQAPTSAAVLTQEWSTKSWAEYMPGAAQPEPR